VAFQEMFSETRAVEPDMPTQTAGRKRTVNERFLQDSGYTPSEQVVVNTKTALKATMFEVIDTLTTELDTRFVNMERLDWVKLFQPTNFHILKTDSLTVAKLARELQRYNRPRHQTEIVNGAHPGAGARIADTLAMSEHGCFPKKETKYSYMHFK